ncbi:efflux transporter outer membrane subunit [Marinilabiliaceae bacterium JC017]|nr:efflux transporter outer membrane subunit [Marinilabiliaceae bacterium JC017]
MKMIRYIFFTVFIAIIVMPSCKVGRKYQRPDLDLPAKLEEQSVDSSTIDDLNWWELYTDTVLQNLISRALENNKDMLIAAARLKENLAKKRISTADLFPALGAKLYSEGEQEVDGDSKELTKSYEARAMLSWELDLWGNIRWGREAAIAEYFSSYEAQRSLKMAIISEVAFTYFELVALENEMRILNQTLDARKEGVRIARLRFEGGLTSETSLQQSEVELARTMTLIPSAERNIRLKENQLAILLGEYPHQITTGNSLINQNIPDYLPAGLPSELIERRPDIRQAEQKLATANALVGVAKTDMFPKITLTAKFGRDSEELSDLIKSPYWFVAGDLLAPIFSAGKLRAKHAAAKAVYEQETYAYQKVVLTAFKEVNNSLMTFRKAKEVRESRGNLEHAARSYLKLAELQYMNGVIGYLDVLDAQRGLLDAEIGHNNAIRDEMLSMVALYKSLGGGWQGDQPVQ